MCIIYILSETDYSEPEDSDPQDLDLDRVLDRVDENPAEIDQLVRRLKKALFHRDSADDDLLGQDCLSRRMSTVPVSMMTSPTS